MGGSTPLPGNSASSPLRLPVGLGGDKVGVHIPKARGLECHVWRPCNTEGMTDI